MTVDVLADARWHCLSTAAGSADLGAIGAPAGDDWSSAVPAAVPGTAAGALLAAGMSIDGRDFDADDWWYRCTFTAESPPGQRFWLELDGLATVADVWLNGTHVLHGENMFLPYSVEVDDLRPANELVIRFSALAFALRSRRPRPRWKVARLRGQNLRWFRTTLLGRLTGWPQTPAPVGPWRAIRLRPSRPAVVRRLETGYSAGRGEIDVLVSVAAPASAGAALSVGGQSFDLVDSGDGRYAGTFVVSGVEPWWPHTHGAQPLYPVELHVDGTSTVIGRVGFRSVTVDRAGGNFAVAINGVPVFCRGAHWTPLDAVNLAEDPTAVRAAVQQVRAGSMNMVRIGAETVYPGPDMLRACDELGVLVWQDCMFAFVDLPSDEDAMRSIEDELSHQLSALSGHPCVTVISGGSEIEQQAAFYGVPVEAALGPVHRTLLPRLLADTLPGLPFVTSTPTGGALPTDSRSGVAHYYGVGAYLRPADDARRAGVRFAAECLAFSNPPERVTVDEACGGAVQAGHSPSWKAAVYRDAGASWDFEDVRTYYVAQLFGPDSQWLRITDPERALDLGRAAVAELFTSTLSEWRRPGSTCSGALVFHHHDLVAGAGLGMVDALGRPKSVWYAMRRTMAPVAVVVTDEGLDGLDAHVLNDSGKAVTGSLRVDLYANGELLVESAQTEVHVSAHGHRTQAVAGMLAGFRDLNHAHHFGPVAYDVVVLSLFGAGPAGAAPEPATGPLLSQVVYTPHRPTLEPDVGLTATARRSDGGGWEVRVSTRRFAQWVSIECPDRVPDDSWFHLAPGESRTVSLPGNEAPFGTVRALNSTASARIDAG